MVVRVHRERDTGRHFYLLSYRLTQKYAAASAAAHGDTFFEKIFSQPLRTRAHIMLHAHTRGEKGVVRVALANRFSVCCVCVWERERESARMGRPSGSLFFCAFVNPISTGASYLNRAIEPSRISPSLSFSPLVPVTHLRCPSLAR